MLVAGQVVKSGKLFSLKNNDSKKLTSAISKQALSQDRKENLLQKKICGSLHPAYTVSETQQKKSYTLIHQMNS